VLKTLREAAKKAEIIYMATDPDREGEAISWHLQDALGSSAGEVKRIEFHEVTKEAIRRALAHPRDIDLKLVNAQQARRILDRLFGYKLSPLLWRKVRGGLSAGRVQSVAVRLVVDREREITAFRRDEYWTIESTFTPNGPDAAFTARLFGREGARYGTPLDEKVTVITNEAEARSLAEEIRRHAYTVAEVRPGERQRHPSPPFTTSTLQQEANRKLGFSAARTMRLAQQLYEGIDLGREGTVGLITYMRTDSVRVSPAAVQEARGYIKATYGAPYLPEAPRQYRSRRDAQEAHEAIRPTAVARTPETVKSHLRWDQSRVYELIWKRFVASQMASAQMETLTVDIAGGPFLFRATGQRLRFDGFLRLYRETTDNGDENGEGWLPALATDQPLRLLATDPTQHFTQPPPRYTEASLVRALEELGIGRPSTYAPTLETLKTRGYVHMEERRLHPTDLGMLVTDLLVEHFPDIVDLHFTAQIEEELDEIEEGRRDWVKVVREFYTPFERDLKQAEKKIEEVEFPEVAIGEPCPESGHPLVRKHGRFGEFIACSGFPECRYTRPVGIGVTCPLDGGEVVQRRSKRGRIFYGCANYPSCKFVSWDRPTDKRCPRDGGILVEKRGRRGTYLRCLNKECGYSEVPQVPQPVTAS
ncbi:MAG: type I DNA topoisomerase, partial [Armatimonadetes bacterium]|nr:type I DNA topoisomerase [Armatimonadota bacterium]